MSSFVVAPWLCVCAAVFLQSQLAAAAVASPHEDEDLDADSFQEFLLETPTASYGTRLGFIAVPDDSDAEEVAGSASARVVLPTKASSTPSSGPQSGSPPSVMAAEKRDIEARLEKMRAMGIRDSPEEEKGAADEKRSEYPKDVDRLTGGVGDEDEDDQKSSETDSDKAPRRERATSPPSCRVTQPPPTLELVIGHKKIRTRDASASSESRVTLYGSQDVEISIRSEAHISVTRKDSTMRDAVEVQAASDQKGTVTTETSSRSRSKRFTSEPLRSNVKSGSKVDQNSPDHSSGIYILPTRKDRRKEDTVLFSGEESVYRYDQGEAIFASVDSPGSDESASHLITDTGISLTRGTTETMTSPAQQPKKGRSEQDTSGDVEAEESELTDAGLSPIQPDDIGLPMADLKFYDEEVTLVSFAEAGTSPHDYHVESSSVALSPLEIPTSEASVYTDSVDMKDTGVSPIGSDDESLKQLSSISTCAPALLVDCDSAEKEKIKIYHLKKSAGNIAGDQSSSEDLVKTQKLYRSEIIVQVGETEIGAKEKIISPPKEVGPKVKELQRVFTESIEKDDFKTQPMRLTEEPDDALSKHPGVSKLVEDIEHRTGTPKHIRRPLSKESVQREVKEHEERSIGLSEAEEVLARLEQMYPSNENVSVFQLQDDNNLDILEHHKEFKLESTLGKIDERLPHSESQEEEVIDTIQSTIESPKVDRIAEDLSEKNFSQRPEKSMVKEEEASSIKKESSIGDDTKLQKDLIMKEDLSRQEDSTAKGDKTVRDDLTIKEDSTAKGDSTMQGETSESYTGDNFVYSKEVKTVRKLDEHETLIETSSRNRSKDVAEQHEETLKEVTRLFKAEESTVVVRESHQTGASKGQRFESLGSFSEEKVSLNYQITTNNEREVKGIEIEEKTSKNSVHSETLNKESLNASLLTKTEQNAETLSLLQKQNLGGAEENVSSSVREDLSRTVDVLEKLRTVLDDAEMSAQGDEDRNDGRAQTSRDDEENSHFLKQSLASFQGTLTRISEKLDPTLGSESPNLPVCSEPEPQLPKSGNLYTSLEETRKSLERIQNSLSSKSVPEDNLKPKQDEPLASATPDAESTSTFCDLLTKAKVLESEISSQDRRELPSSSPSSSTKLNVLETSCLGINSNPESTVAVGSFESVKKDCCDPRPRSLHREPEHMVTELDVSELISEVAECTRQIKQEVRQLKPDLTPTPEGVDASTLNLALARESGMSLIPEVSGVTSVSDVDVTLDSGTEKRRTVSVAGISTARPGSSTDEQQVISSTHVAQLPDVSTLAVDNNLETKALQADGDHLKKSEVSDKSMVFDVEKNYETLDHLQNLESSSGTIETELRAAFIVGVAVAQSIAAEAVVLPLDECPDRDKPDVSSATTSLLSYTNLVKDEKDKVNDVIKSSVYSIDSGTILERPTFDTKNTEAKIDKELRGEKKNIGSGLLMGNDVLLTKTNYKTDNIQSDEQLTAEQMSNNPYGTKHFEHYHPSESERSLEIKHTQEEEALQHVGTRMEETLTFETVETLSDTGDIIFSKHTQEIHDFSFTSGEVSGTETNVLEIVPKLIKKSAEGNAHSESTTFVEQEAQPHKIDETDSEGEIKDIEPIAFADETPEANMKELLEVESEQLKSTEQIIIEVEEGLEKDIEMGASTASPTSRHRIKGKVKDAKKAVGGFFGSLMGKSRESESDSEGQEIAKSSKEKKKLSKKKVSLEETATLNTVKESTSHETHEKKSKVGFFGTLLGKHKDQREPVDMQSGKLNRIATSEGIGSSSDIPSQDTSVTTDSHLQSDEKIIEEGINTKEVNLPTLDKSGRSGIETLNLVTETKTSILKRTLVQVPEIESKEKGETISLVVQQNSDLATGVREDDSQKTEDCLEANEKYVNTSVQEPAASSHHVSENEDASSKSFSSLSILTPSRDEKSEGQTYEIDKHVILVSKDETIAQKNQEYFENRDANLVLETDEISTSLDSENPGQILDPEQKLIPLETRLNGANVVTVEDKNVTVNSGDTEETKRSIKEKVKEAKKVVGGLFESLSHNGRRTSSDAKDIGNSSKYATQAPEKSSSDSPESTSKSPESFVQVKKGAVVTELIEKKGNDSGNVVQSEQGLQADEPNNVTSLAKAENREYCVKTANTIQEEKPITTEIPRHGCPEALLPSLSNTGEVLQMAKELSGVETTDEIKNLVSKHLSTWSTQDVIGSKEYVSNVEDSIKIGSLLEAQMVSADLESSGRRYTEEFQICEEDCSENKAGGFSLSEISSKTGMEKLALQSPDTNNIEKVGSCEDTSHLNRLETEIPSLEQSEDKKSEQESVESRGGSSSTDTVIRLTESEKKKGDGKKVGKIKSAKKAVTGFFGNLIGKSKDLGEKQDEVPIVEGKDEQSEATSKSLSFIRISKEEEETVSNSTHSDDRQPLMKSTDKASKIVDVGHVSQSEVLEVKGDHLCEGVEGSQRSSSSESSPLNFEIEVKSTTKITADSVATINADTTDNVPEDSEDLAVKTQVTEVMKVVKDGSDEVVDKKVLPTFPDRLANQAEITIAPTDTNSTLTLTNPKIIEDVVSESQKEVSDTSRMIGDFVTVDKENVPEIRKTICESTGLPLSCDQNGGTVSATSSTTENMLEETANDVGKVVADSPPGLERNDTNKSQVQSDGSDTTNDFTEVTEEKDEVKSLAEIVVSENVIDATSEAKTLQEEEEKSTMDFENGAMVKTVLNSPDEPPRESCDVDGVNCGLQLDVSEPTKEENNMNIGKIAASIVEEEGCFLDGKETDLMSKSQTDDVTVKRSKECVSPSKKIKEDTSEDQYFDKFVSEERGSLQTRRYELSNEETTDIRERKADENSLQYSVSSDKHSEGESIKISSTFVQDLCLKEKKTDGGGINLPRPTSLEESSVLHEKQSKKSEETGDLVRSVPSASLVVKNELYGRSLPKSPEKPLPARAVAFNEALLDTDEFPSLEKSIDFESVGDELTILAEIKNESFSTEPLKDDMKMEISASDGETPLNQFVSETTSHEIVSNCNIERESATNTLETTGQYEKLSEERDKFHTSKLQGISGIEQEVQEPEMSPGIESVSTNVSCEEERASRTLQMVSKASEDNTAHETQTSTYSVVLASSLEPHNEKNEDLLVIKQTAQSISVVKSSDVSVSTTDATESFHINTEDKMPGDVAERQCGVFEEASLDVLPSSKSDIKLVVASEIPTHVMTENECVTSEVGIEQKKHVQQKESLKMLSPEVETSQAAPNKEISPKSSDLLLNNRADAVFHGISTSNQRHEILKIESQGKHQTETQSTLSCTPKSNSETLLCRDRQKDTFQENENQDEPSDMPYRDNTEIEFKLQASEADIKSSISVEDSLERNTQAEPFKSLSTGAGEEGSVTLTDEDYALKQTSEYLEDQHMQEISMNIHKMVDNISVKELNGKPINEPATLAIEREALVDGPKYPSESIVESHSCIIETKAPPITVGSRVSPETEGDKVTLHLTDNEQNKYEESVPLTLKSTEKSFIQKPIDENINVDERLEFDTKSNNTSMSGTLYLKDTTPSTKEKAETTATKETPKEILHQVSPSKPTLEEELYSRRFHSSLDCSMELQNLKDTTPRSCLDCAGDGLNSYQETPETYNEITVSPQADATNVENINMEMMSPELHKEEPTVSCQNAQSIIDDIVLVLDTSEVSCVDKDASNKLGVRDVPLHNEEQEMSPEDNKQQWHGNRLLNERVIADCDDRKSAADILTSSKDQSEVVVGNILLNTLETQTEQDLSGVKTSVPPDGSDIDNSTNISRTTNPIDAGSTSTSVTQSQVLDEQKQMSSNVLGSSKGMPIEMAHKKETILTLDNIDTSYEKASDKHFSRYENEESGIQIISAVDISAHIATVATDPEHHSLYTIPKKLSLETEHHQSDKQQSVQESPRTQTFNVKGLHDQAVESCESDYVESTNFVHTSTSQMSQNVNILDTEGPKDFGTELHSPALQLQPSDSSITRENTASQDLLDNDIASDLSVQNQIKDLALPETDNSALEQFSIVTLNDEGKDKRSVEDQKPVGSVYNLGNLDTLLTDIPVEQEENLQSNHEKLLPQITQNVEKKPSEMEELPQSLEGKESDNNCRTDDFTPCSREDINTINVVYIESVTKRPVEVPDHTQEAYLSDDLETSLETIQRSRPTDLILERSTVPPPDKGSIESEKHSDNYKALSRQTVSEQKEEHRVVGSTTNTLVCQKEEAEAKEGISRLFTSGKSADYRSDSRDSILTEVKERTSSCSSRKEPINSSEGFEMEEATEIMSDLQEFERLTDFSMTQISDGLSREPSRELLTVVEGTKFIPDSSQIEKDTTSEKGEIFCLSSPEGLPPAHHQEIPRSDASADDKEETMLIYERKCSSSGYINELSESLPSLVESFEKEIDMEHLRDSVKEDAKHVKIAPISSDVLQSPVNEKLRQKVKQEDISSPLQDIKDAPETSSHAQTLMVSRLELESALGTIQDVSKDFSQFESPAHDSLAGEYDVNSAVLLEDVKAASHKVNVDKDEKQFTDPQKVDRECGQNSDDLSPNNLSNILTESRHGQTSWISADLKTNHSEAKTELSVENPSEIRTYDYKLEHISGGSEGNKADQSKKKNELRSSNEGKNKDLTLTIDDTIAVSQTVAEPLPNKDNSQKLVEESQSPTEIEALGSTLNETTVLHAEGLSKKHTEVENLDENKSRNVGNDNENEQILNMKIEPDAGVLLEGHHTVALETAKAIELAEEKLCVEEPCVKKIVKKSPIVLPDVDISQFREIDIKELRGSGVANERVDIRPDRYYTRSSEDQQTSVFPECTEEICTQSSSTLLYSEKKEKGSRETEDTFESPSATTQRTLSSISHVAYDGEQVLKLIHPNNNIDTHDKSSIAQEPKDIASVESTSCKNTPVEDRVEKEILVDSKIKGNTAADSLIYNDCNTVSDQQNVHILKSLPVCSTNAEDDVQIASSSEPMPSKLKEPTVSGENVLPLSMQRSALSETQDTLETAMMDKLEGERAMADCYKYEYSKGSEDSDDGKRVQITEGKINFELLPKEKLYGEHHHLEDLGDKHTVSSEIQFTTNIQDEKFSTVQDLNLQEFDSEIMRAEVQMFLIKESEASCTLRSKAQIDKNTSPSHPISFNILNDANTPFPDEFEVKTQDSAESHKDRSENVLSPALLKIRDSVDSNEHCPTEGKPISLQPPVLSDELQKVSQGDPQKFEEQKCSSSPLQSLSQEFGESLTMHVQVQGKEKQILESSTESVAVVPSTSKVMDDLECDFKPITSDSRMFSTFAPGDASEIRYAMLTRKTFGNVEDEEKEMNSLQFVTQDKGSASDDSIAFAEEQSNRSGLSDLKHAANVAKVQGTSTTSTENLNEEQGVSFKVHTNTEKVRNEPISPQQLLHSLEAQSDEKYKDKIETETGYLQADQIHITTCKSAHERSCLELDPQTTDTSSDGAFSEKLTDISKLPEEEAILSNKDENTLEIRSTDMSATVSIREDTTKVINTKREMIESSTAKSQGAREEINFGTDHQKSRVEMMPIFQTSVSHDFLRTTHITTIEDSTDVTSHDTHDSGRTETVDNNDLLLLTNITTSLQTDEHDILMESTGVYVFNDIPSSHRRESVPDDAQSDNTDVSMTTVSEPIEAGSSFELSETSLEKDSLQGAVESGLTDDGSVVSVSRGIGFRDGVPIFDVRQFSETITSDSSILSDDGKSLEHVAESVSISSENESQSRVPSVVSGVDGDKDSHTPIFDQSLTECCDLSSGSQPCSIEKDKAWSTVQDISMSDDVLQVVVKTDDTESHLESRPVSKEMLPNDGKSSSLSKMTDSSQKTSRFTTLQGRSSATKTSDSVKKPFTLKKVTENKVEKLSASGVGRTAESKEKVKLTFGGDVSRQMSKKLHTVSSVEKDESSALLKKKASYVSPYRQETRQVGESRPRQSFHYMQSTFSRDAKIDKDNPESSVKKMQSHPSSTESTPSKQAQSKESCSSRAPGTSERASSQKMPDSTAGFFGRSGSQSQTSRYSNVKGSQRTDLRGNAKETFTSRSVTVTGSKTSVPPSTRTTQIKSRYQTRSKLPQVNKEQDLKIHVEPSKKRSESKTMFASEVSFIPSEIETKKDNEESVRSDSAEKSEDYSSQKSISDDIVRIPRRASSAPIPAVQEPLLPSLRPFVHTSLPSSPNRIARSAQHSIVTHLVTSEVFTRTVESSDAIEVVYRQPGKQARTVDGDQSFIDTTDSSLSESTAIPSSSTSSERRRSQSASPKPSTQSDVVSSMDIVHTDLADLTAVAEDSSHHTSEETSRSSDSEADNFSDLEFEVNEEDILKATTSIDCSSNSIVQFVSLPHGLDVITEEDSEVLCESSGFSETEMSLNSNMPLISVSPPESPGIDEKISKEIRSEQNTLSIFFSADDHGVLTDVDIYEDSDFDGDDDGRVSPAIAVDTMVEFENSTHEVLNIKSDVSAELCGQTEKTQNFLSLSVPDLEEEGHTDIEDVGCDDGEIIVEEVEDDTDELRIIEAMMGDEGVTDISDQIRSSLLGTPSPATTPEPWACIRKQRRSQKSPKRGTKKKFLSPLSMSPYLSDYTDVDTVPSNSEDEIGKKAKSLTQQRVRRRRNKSPRSYKTGAEVCATDVEDLELSNIEDNYDDLDASSFPGLSDCSVSRTHIIQEAEKQLTGITYPDTDAEDIFLSEREDENVMFSYLNAPPCRSIGPSPDPGEVFTDVEDIDIEKGEEVALKKIEEYYGSVAVKHRTRVSQRRRGSGFSSASTSEEEFERFEKHIVRRKVPKIILQKAEDVVSSGNEDSVDHDFTNNGNRAVNDELTDREELKFDDHDIATDDLLVPDADLGTLTDTETYEDGESLRPLTPEPHLEEDEDEQLPEPVRELTLLRETVDGHPESVVLPLGDAQPKGLTVPAEETSGTTDIEDMGEDSEEDVLECQSPEIPELDGGMIQSSDSIKLQKKRSNLLLLGDCGVDIITDTEDVYLSTNTSRRRKGKTRGSAHEKPGLLCPQTPLVGVSDVEEIEVSDFELPASIPHGVVVVQREPSFLDVVPSQTGEKTDVEDMSGLSGADDDEQYDISDGRITPEYLRNLESERVSTVEGDGPFSAEQRIQISLGALNLRARSLVPPEGTSEGLMQTDVEEDIMTSADEEVIKSARVSIEAEQSEVFETNIRKLNLDTPDEAKYVKGSVLRDVPTDVEDVGLSEEELTGRIAVIDSKPEVCVCLTSHEAGKLDSSVCVCVTRGEERLSLILGNTTTSLETADAEGTSRSCLIIHAPYCRSLEECLVSTLVKPGAFLIVETRFPVNECAPLTNPNPNAPDGVCRLSVVQMRSGFGTNLLVYPVAWLPTFNTQLAVDRTLVVCHRKAICSYVDFGDIEVYANIRKRRTECLASGTAHSRRIGSVPRLIEGYERMTMATRSVARRDSAGTASRFTFGVEVQMSGSQTSCGQSQQTTSGRWIGADRCGSGNVTGGGLVMVAA